MIIQLDEIKSTNEFLNNLTKKQNIESGTVVITNKQTNGKGQRNNYWESEPYKNITISIYQKYSNIDIQNQFLISMTVSLGIIDFLEQLHIKSKIKWPNDIYVNDKKICGILIENNILKNKIKSSIIGIGLNVNQTNFIKSTKNPTSLKLLNNKNYDLKIVTDKLINSVNKKLNNIAETNFDEIKSSYIKNMYLYNEYHTFTVNDKKITAKIINTENNGMLVIETKEKKIEKYFFKEIKF